MEEGDKQDEFDGDGRRKRKRKVPKRYINKLYIFNFISNSIFIQQNVNRYMESIQGKELDKIFKQEGVLEEDDVKIKYQIEENLVVTSGDESNSDEGIHSY